MSYMLHLYFCTVEVEDDPYEGEFRVLVQAHNRIEARPLARKAALDSYRVQAGGWSKAPRARVGECEEYWLPQEPGVIMAGGGSLR